jgi:hypothetical protein
VFLKQGLKETLSAQLCSQAFILILYDTAIDLAVLTDSSMHAHYLAKKEIHITDIDRWMTPTEPSYLNRCVPFSSLSDLDWMVHSAYGGGLRKICTCGLWSGKLKDQSGSELS